MSNTLVFGAPGAGKTTYCRAYIGSRLLYDLDLIAAALTGEIGKSLPHPYNDDAREVANQMLTPILNSVKRCGADLIVIRAAPDLEEVAAIQPSRVIWIRSDTAENRWDNWNRSRLRWTADAIRQMGYMIEEISGR